MSYAEEEEEKEAEILSVGMRRADVDVVMRICECGGGGVVVFSANIPKANTTLVSDSLTVCATVAQDDCGDGAQREGASWIWRPSRPSSSCGN